MTCNFEFGKLENSFTLKMQNLTNVVIFDYFKDNR